MVARLFSMLLVCAVATARPVTAMEFAFRDGVLSGAGVIAVGDAARFQQFLKDDKVVSDPSGNPTIRLSGSGGDGGEGMALGRVLREAEIPAMVARGAICADACALAFLGGTRAYATGVGTGRVLEFGGGLSFRGVIASGGGAGASKAVESKAVAVEALQQYARELRGIDLGALVEAAVALPPGVSHLSRGRLMKALSIELEGFPAKTPDDWYVHACRTLVAKHLSALDDAAERVMDTVKTIGSIKALRQALVGGREDDPPIAKALEGLEDSDAIDLAVGGAFFLDQRKPILDARAVTLERGAGFYMDVCVAVRSRDMLGVVLVDAVGHTTIYEQFNGAGAFLAMVGGDADLW